MNMPVNMAKSNHGRYNTSATVIVTSLGVCVGLCQYIDSIHNNNKYGPSALYQMESNIIIFR